MQGFRISNGSKCEGEKKKISCLNFNSLFCVYINRMAQILMNVWTVQLTIAAVSDINVVIIHKVASIVYAKKVST